jgi:RpiR family carbohydrate utilization transcriptional regulator
MEPVIEQYTVLHRISSKLPYLAPSLRQVAETVLRDPAKAQSMTISELADEAGVAESTVSRFVKELGVPSFKALLLEVAEATFLSRTVAENTAAENNHPIYEGVGRGDLAEDIVGKIQRSSIQALRQTGLRQDVESIKAVVTIIENARTLMFVCMGSSSIAAEEAVMRFTRAGKKCILFRDQSVQVMVASVLDADDVVFAFSDSGRSTPIIEALRVAKSRGSKTVAITSSERTPLLEHADVALFTSGVASGGELYGESVTSKWGQILVVDILYATYAARHYDQTLKSLDETYQSAIRQSRND